MRGLDILAVKRPQSVSETAPFYRSLGVDGEFAQEEMKQWWTIMGLDEISCYKIIGFKKLADTWFKWYGLGIINHNLFRLFYKTVVRGTKIK